MRFPDLNLSLKFISFSTQIWAMHLVFILRCIQLAIKYHPGYNRISLQPYSATILLRNNIIPTFPLNKGVLFCLFPTVWGQYIEKLSEYMASTGKRYQSHAATIRRWAGEDAKKTVTPSRNRDYSVKEDETV